MSLRIITFVIAVGLATVALLFSIICVSTDSWISADINLFNIFSERGELGLWSFCAQVGDQRECQNLNEDSVRKGKLLNAAINIRPSSSKLVCIYTLVSLILL